MTQTNSDADATSVAAATEERPRSNSVATQGDVETLQNQIRDLQQNAKYRSLFLSRLAHELRTPLTSILGFSEILLSQERLTSAQRGFCERIQSSAQQLKSSLDQLSDLARLEAGQTKLAADKIALGETLHDVLPALARSAEKKHVRLMSSAADGLPVIVSDRARVRLIIYNVLSNAIFRSPEGSIVKAEAVATADGVAISVVDVGDQLAEPSRIGILEADDNSSTGELGLSIARQNVEILGGSLIALNDDREVRVIASLPLQLPA